MEALSWLDDESRLAVTARLTHSSGAFGGTGVSPPGHVSMIATFEVAASVAIAALRVVELEILDASGAIVARALPPIEVRVSLPGRDEHHNLRSAPFGGAIEAGANVRLSASAGLTPLPGAYSTKLRYRASISIAAAETDPDVPLVLEGPLDQPWPTAAPGRP